MMKLSPSSLKKPNDVHKSTWGRLIITPKNTRRVCSMTTNSSFMIIPKQSDFGSSPFTTWFRNHNDMQRDKIRLCVFSNQHYYSSIAGSSSPSPQLSSLSPPQQYSFSSTSNKKSTYYYNPKQSDSINLIHLIPKQTLETIQTLPEVQQLLSIILLEKTTVHDGIHTTKNTILESIDRAIQIFQHVGIEEHKAMMVLKAMYLSQICDYQECCHILSTILTTYYSHENKDTTDTTSVEKKDILSSLVKMNWYNGSFTSGLQYANILDGMISSTNSEPNEIFEKGCTMNATALCKLLSTQTLNDVDIVQLTTGASTATGQHDWSECQEEYIQIQSLLEEASQMLEKAYYLEFQQQQHDDDDDETTSHVNNTNDLGIQLALSCASSYCNQGIVSLLWNMMNNEPYHDSVLNSWKHGLHILKELEQKQNISSSAAPNIHYVYLCKLIQARIYCNMAWTTLFQSSYQQNNNYIKNNKEKIQQQQQSSPPLLKEEELKMASEYSTLALKQHDDLIQILSKHQNHNQNDTIAFLPVHNQELQILMGRTLGLVASCYARAGSAVTAEGLLQSALDTYKHPSLMDNKRLNPLVQIDSRSASLYYSSLCRNWEKRNSDAKLYEQSALLINDGIVCDNWRDISAIYSGLWLFTVSDF
jgi:hypothetical protein